MWLLLIIMLDLFGAETDKHTSLETYATQRECNGERNRIGFAMAEAYPYERDFVIACRLKEAV